VIREEPMALFAGSLTNHAEVYHVWQGLATAGAETESCSAVVANPLDFAAPSFDEPEYLLRGIGWLLTHCREPSVNWLGHTHFVDTTAG
jgi:hypothetical protein